MNHISSMSVAPHGSRISFTSLKSTGAEPTCRAYGVVIFAGSLRIEMGLSEFELTL